MAYPDPASRAGRADWRSILTRALPEVDIFLPSYEEIVHMLSGPRPENFWVRDEPDAILYDQIESLASSLLALGTPIVVLKLGTRGIYLRTGSKTSLDNLSTILDIDAWANRELWTTVFEANLAGTNGAGDCTIAGFLYAVLHGFSPESACTAACAVGGCSVEAPDATSAVQPWGSVETRLDQRWKKRQSTYLAQWTELARGVFAGQKDRVDGAKSN
jgi:sugar/nucleoside kinase (ribokinase family)